MADQPAPFLERTTLCLFARAGVYSADPGVGAMPEGIGAILLLTLLGAFFGLMAGLMLGHILRYLSFIMGRNLGGMGWAILGAIAGAAAFAWLAMAADEQ